MIQNIFNLVQILNCTYLNWNTPKLVNFHALHSIVFSSVLELQRSQTINGEVIETLWPFLSVSGLIEFNDLC